MSLNDRTVIEVELPEFVLRSLRYRIAGDAVIVTEGTLEA